MFTPPWHFSWSFAGAVGEIVEGVAIHDCVFTRLDGNALLLSGFVRSTSIARNTFEWIGDNVSDVRGLMCVLFSFALS